jgi:hypothetical protein
LWHDIFKKIFARVHDPGDTGESAKAEKDAHPGRAIFGCGLQPIAINTQLMELSLFVFC